MDPSTDAASADAVAERLFGAVLGTVDLMSTFLGDRLGWYRSLADDGPATPPELAKRTGTDTRYAREWLEQQAVTGLLHLDSDGAADERVFSIPPGTAEVLTNQHSLNFMAPVGRMFGAVGPALPQLLEAYRTGDGVSWNELGDHAREGQADANRPWFEHRLADALAGVEDLHGQLSRSGTRVLDVGCGGGWSSIALSRAYPTAAIHGIDIDAPSVAMATENAQAAGVADRVRFSHGDAAELPADQYDVAFAFECVHDMPRPVDVLAAVRKSLAPGAPLIVMDEAVAESFAPDGDELERMMYGFSLFVCLPDGRSSSPSVATGTVMRPARLGQYAEAAGFTEFEVLPITDFSFFRFYQIR
ncbi:methyltransferase family protein [Promicromonospora sp. AC04]|uniref:class I SAM-dependent methyltransferase n=1 Tax=Promicromonospora sp. AC04 TaxID=2135723 RepID=UPI000D395CA4|nr:class I SAM-dependent methyltransferase [Promicromonospora sp. AC04]PUB24925.1 methyltransferase family protein [Promicromonospora sp. AC04]